MDNLRQTKIREALSDLGQRPLYHAEKGTSLRQVLAMLSNFRILSLPVVELNSTTTYPGPPLLNVLGLIDVLDLVAYTTQGFRAREDPLRWSSLEGKTAGDLLALFPRTRDVKIITTDATLGELAAIMGKQGEHRVLVIERARPVRVLSQTDVVRYLRSNTDKIEAEVLHTPLCQLDLPKQVLRVSPHKSTISAYWHLLRHDVSAVAVVDENGKLVDTLSASDLRGCAEENLHSLTMPVREFLASHPRQRPAGGEILRCAPTDLLGSAINKLVEAQVHRLWITDEGEKPVSVLSLTDVIRAVLG